MKYATPYSLLKVFKKAGAWEKTFLIFLTLIFVVTVKNVYKRCSGITESFETGTNKNRALVVKKGSGIYDDFYSKVYDNLVFCKSKNDFEVKTIIRSTRPTQSSRILDIGSGTGHHVAAFDENGFNAIGIDVSPSMVQQAKQTYPDSKYQVADALKAMTFPQQSFTHITCLYFTIYYIKNKREFLKNCYDWLTPGGYMVVHLVDRNNFDPILPAGDPLALISAQRYAKKRITSTVVKFNGYDYRSNFDYKPKEDEAIMNEEFKNTKTGDVRKNEHTLYMPTQKYILSLAKDTGFIMLSQTDMMKCQYESQHLYVLQKPN